jgi:hypothetical protein
MSKATNIANQVSPSATAANDIRDIKPPVAIPGGWEWLWWTLLVLALVAFIAAVVWLWLRRKRQPAVTFAIPPHERARRKLAAALDFFNQPKQFCILVSDAVRLYLEERFGLQAPERTTEEFLADLKASPSLNQPQKDSLQQFLSACDLVKFARYQPGRLELEGLYNSALRLIEETEPKPELPMMEENSIVNRQSPIANPK